VIETTVLLTECCYEYQKRNQASRKNREILKYREPPFLKLPNIPTVTLRPSQRRPSGRQGVSRKRVRGIPYSPFHHWQSLSQAGGTQKLHAQFD
jgi:hypothetical protein